MSLDPLSIFLSEKTADELAPDTVLDPAEQKPFTNDPDPESIDPGERAMAGMLAIGGSAAGGIATWVGQTLLKGSLHNGVAPMVKQIALSPAGTIAEHISSHSPARSKLLGLFDVEARRSEMPIAALKDLEHASLGFPLSHPFNVDVAKGQNAVSAMMETVDSFIDKHNLKTKGVTVAFKQGPLNKLLGPRYEIVKKRVYLPDLHKDFALHELGHAADYTKGRWGKARGFLEPILTRSIQFALPAALIAGDRIKELLPGTIDDKAISFMQDHAPAIVGATLAATTLYPEAKASVLALQHIAKTEGQASALKSLKRFGAGWGVYLLGAIPTVVGMSLARKYMRQARYEKGDTEDLVQKKLRELEKTSGLDIVNEIREAVPAAIRFVRSSSKDLSHLGSQVAEQSKQMIKNKEVLARLGSAAKEVGTDPVFTHGALVSAIPAAIASLYLYGSHSGKEIRKRMDPEDIQGAYARSRKGLSTISNRTSEEWREENPMKFAGLVAAGAAMSGGIMSKFFSDLARVL